MELAGNGATFAHEEVFADQWLPRIYLVAACLLDDGRDFADFGEVENDRHVVKAAQGQRDLADVGVTGALSHPIDGALNPRRTGAHGCDCARGRHPEIIVTVEVQRYRRSDPITYLANQVLHGLGPASTDGINDDDFSRARIQRSTVDLAQKFEVRASAVNCEEGNADRVPRSVGYGFRDASQNLVTSEAIGFQLDVACGSFDNGCAQAKPDKFFDVSFDRTRESPEFSFQACRLHELNRLGIFRGNARKARFNAADTKSVQVPRDLQLLLG